jgi:hypothetical protein
MKRLLIVILLAVATLGVALKPAFSTETMSKSERRRLILLGGKLWGVYCNQCHNARPSGEKAPYEWDQEIMHMRTLGNIPAKDARAIVEYLKAR